MKKVEAVRVIDYIFNHTVAKLPYYRKFSPHIRIIGNSDHLIKQTINQELANFSGNHSPKFLDVGARDATKKNLASGFKYVALDVNPKSPEVIQADICACPQIADNSFDVVFSTDVLEHVKQPWLAANECLRITKSGGLIIHRTLFSYRYHPSPVDYWRFTSQCLEYLFTESQQAETLVSGYDIRGRRRDRRGNFLSSKPPVDWLGGFRENWQVLWIGRKL